MKEKLKGYLYTGLGAAAVGIIAGLILSGIVLQFSGCSSEPEAPSSQQIVRLVSPSHHGHGGTGFSVVAPSGRVYILTNSHVCGAAENGVMQAVSGDDEDARFFYVHIIERSKDTDLCLLDAIPGQTGLTVGSGVSVGQNVHISGHPLLEPLTTTRGYVTNFQEVTVLLSSELTAEQCAAEGGYARQEDGFFGPILLCVRTLKAFRTTVIIYPGNSGSPVLNGAGEVVGVAFAANNRTNWAYCIPHTDVVKFLEIY